MATQTLTAAMPALELTSGTRLVLEAINPTTGAAVAGVTVNDFVVYARETAHEDPSELALSDVYLTPKAGDVINPANFGGPAG
jgi:hypothetical protein